MTICVGFVESLVDRSKSMETLGTSWNSFDRRDALVFCLIYFCGLMNNVLTSSSSPSSGRIDLISGDLTSLLPIPLSSTSTSSIEAIYDTLNSQLRSTFIPSFASRLYSSNLGISVFECLHFFSLKIFDNYDYQIDFLLPFCSFVIYVRARITRITPREQLSIRGPRASKLPIFTTSPSPCAIAVIRCARLRCCGDI